MKKNISIVYFLALLKSCTIWHLQLCQCIKFHEICMNIHVKNISTYIQFRHTMYILIFLNKCTYSVCVCVCTKVWMLNLKNTFNLYKLNYVIMSYAVQYIMKEYTSLNHYSVKWDNTDLQIYGSSSDFKNIYSTLLWFLPTSLTHFIILTFITLAYLDWHYM